MDKSFNYDFLKLEFNDIYEDLNKLKDQTNLEITKGLGGEAIKK